MKINTYRQFKQAVKEVTHPKDFNQSNTILEDIDSCHWFTFIKVLAMNAKINEAALVVERLFKISVSTKLTMDEALQVCVQARTINTLIDEK